MTLKSILTDDALYSTRAQAINQVLALGLIVLFALALSINVGIPTENRKALMANCERLHLQNPENTEAKMMLAYCWIGESDSALQERAMQMFREVAANRKEPKWSASAERMLTNEEWLGKLRGKAGQPVQRPKDWHSLHMAFEENPNDLEIQCDLGVALMGSPHDHARGRGRQMLQGVAAGKDAAQAERARGLLASVERAAAK